MKIYRVNLLKAWAIGMLWRLLLVENFQMQHGYMEMLKGPNNYLNKSGGCVPHPDLMDFDDAQTVSLRTPPEE